MKKNIISFIEKIEFHKNRRLIQHLLNKFDFLTKKEHLTNCALNCNEPGISYNNYCDNEIIVSLTTYGKRLFEVFLAIESIMQQTLKPNKIVLWLAEELKNENIPVFIKNQTKRGLEIKYCKDIRSYKKLIPALIEYPKATIITIDDDAIYHYDLMENFINEHIKYPDLILSGRMHLMRLQKNGKPYEYSRWLNDSNSIDISPVNFPTGVGGILYPPDCFNSEVLNEEVFMKICGFADDIWFKSMALYNNTLSKNISTYRTKGRCYFSNVQDIKLADINVKKNMNDTQLKAVFDKYNLYDKLKV
jgi:hypothetical protein